MHKLPLLNSRFHQISHPCIRFHQISHLCSHRTLSPSRLLPIMHIIRTRRPSVLCGEGKKLHVKFRGAR
jgi:hypothetical protein